MPEKFTSLVDIIDSRPDLQGAINTVPGFNINDWYNQVGSQEYPNVTLVPPGDPRIQDPKTLTAEAQAQEEPAQVPTPSQVADPNIGGSFVIPGIGELKEGQFVESGVDIFQVEGGILRKVTNPETVPSGSKFFINPNSPAFSQIPFGADITLSTETADQEDTDDDIDFIDIPNELPEELKAVLRAMQTQLDALVTAGKTINADIEITPEKTAEFLMQAQTEFGQFFEEQIGLNLTDLSREITDVIGEFGRTQEDILRQQKRGREQISESAAERGVAFSTGRQRQEREIGEATQRVLGQTQRGALRETGRLGRIVEREIGTKRLKKGFQAPSLRPLSFTGATRQPISTFTPSVTPIIGNLARRRTEAEQLRVSQLESSFRRRSGLSFS